MAVVLVVEDEDAVRGLLGDQLRRAGHEPLLASDGVMALDLIRSAGHVDASIVDWGLPGADGFEVLEALAHEGYPPECAVLLTARTGSSIRARAREMGAAYLAKPYAMRDLLALVDAISGKACSEQRA